GAKMPDSESQATSLEPLGKPVPAFGAVCGLAATFDGQTFVAGAHGPGHSVLGQTNPGKVLGLPLRHLAQDAAFTPDGRIALTCNGSSLRLWDIASGKQVGPNLTLPPHQHRRTTVFGDNHTALAVRNDGIVRR